MTDRLLLDDVVLLGLIYLAFGLRAIATVIRWSREEQAARRLARSRRLDPTE
jgi:hypothetical protein